MSGTEIGPNRRKQTETGALVPRYRGLSPHSRPRGRPMNPGGRNDAAQGVQGGAERDARVGTQGDRSRPP
eukprot:2614460-Rhodomonas_salina.1